MERIREMMKLCEGEISLRINEHRTDGQTATRVLKNREIICGPLSIDPEVRKVMEETNTIIELHLYPWTPVGFFCVSGHDLDAVLDEGLRLLREDSGGV